MIMDASILLLGFIAGFTIFLGIPIAKIKNIPLKLVSIFNSLAIGILLFLFIEIIEDVLDKTKDAILGAVSVTSPMQTAFAYSSLMVLGVLLPLVSLTFFEKKYIKKVVMDSREDYKAKARAIALIIAIAIGVHNFSEGLAIGQSYASGAISFAVLLVIGFSLHNASEGFGIASPLAGHNPSWRYLFFLGLIGGGPTFAGTLIGSIYHSTSIELFSLSLAAGAILFVIREMIYQGKKQSNSISSIVSIAIGMFIGFGTEIILKIAFGK